jgi:signal transduction histidine kinase
MCVSVALLAWFGLRASREFQESSRLLVQRRAEESARLLVAALTRDMRAVQTSVLAQSPWDERGPDTAQELTALVASAFARYPYPEAFLAWDARRPSAGVTFYTRADRPPSWAPRSPGPLRYPVRVVDAPTVAPAVLGPLRRDAALGRAYSITETTIDGARYQVVTLLRYTDQLRQELASARGFLVNLDWVRAHYFGDLTGQVAGIVDDTPGLRMAIADDRGRTVVGEIADSPRAFVSREFPLTFFDPVLAAPNASVVPAGAWSVMVTAAPDASVATAQYSADVTLGIAALTAFVLALGLGVTVRAMRMSAELAEMRAEFMSSVTHELKTPIASIQAMGETLSRGRLRDPRAQQDYGAVVTQEARRLGRLVNNVLAYSRITDVADVYSFESLDLDEVIESCLARFKRQLQEPRYQLSVDIAADVPSIMADRAAMELLFDNLIDNAVRHAGSGARDLAVKVRAQAHEGTVTVEVSDRGAGIAPDDLARVSQKFVRGRNAAPGGSGLGLAIVTRIVADHRGTFTLESALGRGTTARVVLPVADERAERRPSLLARVSL